MRYELLLQPPPGTPFDSAAVRTALVQAGATDAGALLRFEAHGATVECRPVLEAGLPVAWSLAVPLSADVKPLEQTLSWALARATALGLIVADPQRAAPCSEGSQGAVTAEYLRVARYAGLYAGEPEAVTLSVAEPDSPWALKGTPLALLALLVFGLVLLATWGLLGS